MHQGTAIFPLFSIFPYHPVYELEWTGLGCKSLSLVDHRFLPFFPFLGPSRLEANGKVLKGVKGIQSRPSLFNLLAFELCDATLLFDYLAGL